MSLLNTMLQDLQKRRPQTDDVNLLSHLNGSSSPAAGRSAISSIWLWIIIVLVLLSVSAFLGMRIYQIRHIRLGLKKQSQVVTVVKPAASAPIATAKAAVSAPTVLAPVANTASTAISTNVTVKPAAVSDVKILHDKDKTMVTLALTHVVHYQLSMRDDRQQLTIELPNTTLQNPLPKDVQDPIVKNVTSIIDQKNLKLVFNVWPSTHVDGVQLRDEPNAAPELLLTLSNNSLVQKQMLVEKVATLPDPDEVAAQHYQDALVLIDHDQIEQAMDVLRQTLAEKPDFKEARTSLVVLLLQQQRFDEVSQLLKAGFSMEPDYIPFVELQARLYLAEGKLKEALTTLKRFSPSITSYPNYYAIMAALQQQLGNPSAAVDLYGRLLAVNNTNSKWWMGLGIGFESIHSTNAAIEAYRKASATGNLTPNMQIYVTNRIRKLGG